MKLTQLKEATERAIKYAKECGVDPDAIPVTLQIDRAGDDPIWCNSDVELHYDNNACATGCVITAFLEERPGCGNRRTCSASIYEAIGDVAARLYHSWSWGRCVTYEQHWAQLICDAVGVPRQECPLPQNLQGPPIVYKPNTAMSCTAPKEKP